MAWQVDASDYGGSIINFSQGMHAAKPTEQFPWMSMRFPNSDVAPVTAAGCCMALTVNLFDWYVSGHPIADYFKWLQTPKGISTIINMQTEYLGWSTTYGAAPVKTTSDIATFLNGLRRKVEDKIYRARGYISVNSPTFPSLPKSLASEVTEDYAKKGRVFKPIYLASLSGQAHAIGAVLDYNQSTYLFFDPNEGLADFPDAGKLKTWLKSVQPEYDSAFAAFFADTKSHP